IRSALAIVCPNRSGHRSAIIAATKSWEKFMQLRQICLLTSVGLGAMLVQAGLAPSFAQTAALTGTVSSTEEGNMEGVLVSAKKKEGSTIAVTVVTNDKGNYAFPADRLSPGKYKITMRAIGYTLPATEATVTAG